MKECNPLIDFIPIQSVYTFTILLIRKLLYSYLNTMITNHPIIYKNINIYSNNIASYLQHFMKVKKNLTIDDLAVGPNPTADHQFNRSMPFFFPTHLQSLHNLYFNRG